MTEKIPTNLRLLVVLETLAEAEGALTAAEIGRRIGLPKPTTHRLCQTLIEEGFISRQGDGKRLAPGRRARTMSSGLLHASAHQLARRQVLMRVSQTVGETVNFAAPREDGMTYIDRVETDWPFRIQLPVGSNVPFHCTASGKTFLAALPTPRRDQIVHSLNLTRQTCNTITDPTELAAELANTATRGYAIDNGELYEGMIALAVPVRDNAGRFIAALAFHGPEQRLSAATALAHLDMMKGAAEELAAIS